jgi:hypothetical protein
METQVITRRRADWFEKRCPKRAVDRAQLRPKAYQDNLGGWSISEWSGGGAIIFPSR